MILVRPFRGNKATLAFVRTLRGRMLAAERGVTYNSARMVLESIKEALRGPKYADYVKSLKLVEIATNLPAYAIRATPKRKKISKLDTGKTVLYIRPRSKKTARVPEYVQILAKYSPWTFATLPAVPRRQEATIVYRTVREKEVTAITKQREDKRSEWEKELVAVGKTPEKAVTFPPKGKATPDIAFEALRIEFGLGPGSGKSHWRPALRMLAKAGLQSMLSTSSESMRPVVDPFYSGWKTPPQAEGVISVSMAAGFRGFQSRLKIM